MPFTGDPISAATFNPGTANDEQYFVFTHATPTLQIDNFATAGWTRLTVISGVSRTGVLTIDPQSSVNINGSTASISVPIDWVFTLENEDGTNEWLCSIHPPKAITAFTLDELAAAVADYDMGSNALTSLGAATAIDDTARWQDTWEWRDVPAAKTAAYTLVLDDAGKLNRMNGSFDFTIPANSTAAYPTGTQLGLLLTSGAGDVIDAAGVTLNSETAGAAVLPMTLDKIIVATKLDTDAWNVSGV